MYKLIALNDGTWEIKFYYSNGIPWNKSFVKATPTDCLSIAAGLGIHLEPQHKILLTLV